MNAPNALAETINGMFTTEVIKFLGPWKSVGQVEWYNNTRLHSAIGYATPNEAEESFYETLSIDKKAAQSLNHKISGKPGAVQKHTVRGRYADPDAGSRHAR